MIGGQVAMLHPSSPAIGRDAGIPRRNLSGAKVRLLRLGHTMIIAGGAARFGRRTARPHACSAAPASFMRGDWWREAAVSDHYPTPVMRLGSSYGIPLPLAVALTDQLLALSLYEAMDSFSAARARFTRLVNETGSADPDLLEAICGPSDRALRAIYDQVVEVCGPFLRSGSWLAAGLADNLWQPIEPASWHYVSRNPTLKWMGGELLLAGREYYNVRVRPIDPIVFEDAAPIFCYSRKTLEHIRHKRARDEVTVRASAGRFEGELLGAIMGGLYYADGLDVSAGQRRRITPQDLNITPRLFEGGMQLASGEMIRDVRVWWPDPFGKVVPVLTTVANHDEIARSVSAALAPVMDAHRDVPPSGAVSPIDEPPAKLDSNHQATKAQMVTEAEKSDSTKLKPPRPKGLRQAGRRPHPIWLMAFRVITDGAMEDGRGVSIPTQKELLGVLSASILTGMKKHGINPENIEYANWLPGNTSTQEFLGAVFGKQEVINNVGKDISEVDRLDTDFTRDELFLLLNEFMRRFKLKPCGIPAKPEEAFVHEMSDWCVANIGRPVPFNVMSDTIDGAFYDKVEDVLPLKIYRSIALKYRLKVVKSGHSRARP